MGKEESGELAVGRRADRTPRCRPLRSPGSGLSRGSQPWPVDGTSIWEEQAATVQTGSRAWADVHCGQSPVGKALCPCGGSCSVQGPGMSRTYRRACWAAGAWKRACSLWLASQEWQRWAQGSRPVSATAPGCPPTLGLSTSRGPHASGPVHVAGSSLAFAWLSRHHSPLPLVALGGWWPPSLPSGLGCFPPPLPLPSTSLLSGPASRSFCLQTIQEPRHRYSHSLLCLFFCSLVLCSVLQPHGHTLSIL